MKKFYVTLTLVMIVSQLIFAISKPEEIANDIIKAYQNSDEDLLKKHASGILIPAINEALFSEKEVTKINTMLENWNGKIIETRYAAENMAGKIVLSSVVYFMDCPEENDLGVVMLSSVDNSDWKAIGFGITNMERSEFEKFSLQMTDPISIETKKEYKKFTIEMASGVIVKNPSIEKLEELIASLNDDNFFLSLSHDDGFIQTAYSSDGFTIEYSNSEGYFVASELYNLEKAVQVFSKYMNEEKDWITDIDWE
jgi:hypothetical protein